MKYLGDLEMNIEFIEIDRSNYNECIELKVSENQKKVYSLKYVFFSTISL
ncbi:hypothetical protein [Clostridium nigeriense]